MSDGAAGTGSCVAKRFKAFSLRLILFFICDHESGRPLACGGKCYSSSTGVKNPMSIWLRTRFRIEGVSSSFG